MDSKHTFIQIHPKDNTAVALTSLKKDSVLNLNGRMYTLLEDIPQGHKFALEKISSGEAVIKYGSPIGYATEDIPAGSWIHTHNMKTGLRDLLNYSYQKEHSFLEPTKERFFDGTDEPMEKPVFETKSGSSPPLAVSTTLQRSLPKKPKHFSRKALMRSLLSHILMDVRRWAMIRNTPARSWQI